MTLLEITGQESGIIIYDDKVARVVNWSGCKGVPYEFLGQLIDLPMELPEIAVGIRHDNIPLLLEELDEFDRGSLPDDEPIPSTGTVYKINSRITVIAPDDWC